jgi:hypothetical protein
MTTVSTMLSSTVPARMGDALARLVWRSATLVLGLATLAGVWGCASSTNERQLTAPRMIVAPYDTSRGETLWAVAPLRNESGTSLVDTFQVTEKLVLAIEESRGLRCLPLNRVLETMRAMELSAIRTPSDARMLADALGVDGLIVGSITSYDPYNPPKLGLSIGLFARPGAMGTPATGSMSDPRTLASRPREYEPFPGSQVADRPVTVVSSMLDASNHQVLMDIRTYAQGRHDDRSALGWELYLQSMDRYTQFAAHHVVDRLVQNEWLRLTNEAGAQAQAPQ